MKRYVKNSTAWDGGWTKGYDKELGHTYYVYEIPGCRAVVEEFDDDGDWGWDGRIFKGRNTSAEKSFHGKDSREAAMNWAEKKMFNKRVTSATEPTGKVTLVCLYERYTRHESDGLRRVWCTGDNLLDALETLTTKIDLYLYPEEIEEKGMTADDVIDNIIATNGDGCAWIALLQNKTTGEIYIDETDFYDKGVL